MELRIDRLLHRFRCAPGEIIAAIDNDPLLVRRQSGDLILANASKLLFTPRDEHHLFAKGIVYRRDPYELVSLPLLKIYNLGEKEILARHLLPLLHEAEGVSETRLHFLRKYDGTMIQRFQWQGKVYLTTRGMIEGARVTGFESQDDENQGKRSHFDYLGTARRLAERKYPAVLEPLPGLEKLTLVFEFVHPESRIITDYGDLEDLILHSAFDHESFRYLPLGELQAARAYGFRVIDAYHPRGTSLEDRIDDLLTGLVGTDEEGAVLVFEHDHQVVYRVKVKSPEYLRLLRLMVQCNYPRTVEMLDSFEELPDWEAFRALLEKQGSENVPEEVLEEYRAHYDRFLGYLRACERIREEAQREFDAIRRELGLESITEPRERRKAFAARVMNSPRKSLLFSAFDDRLTLARVREFLPIGTETENQLG